MCVSFRSLNGSFDQAEQACTANEALLMNQKTKRVVGILALALGTAGAFGTVLVTNRMRNRRERERANADVWARPGMAVTFRAELMPGRDTDARTYRVKDVLPSGRVTLDGFAGEHVEQEFVLDR
jgi:hypothetical protein